MILKNVFRICENLVVKGTFAKFESKIAFFIMCNLCILHKIRNFFEFFF